MGKLREGSLEADKLDKMAEQYGSLKVLRTAPVTRADERVVALGDSGTEAKARKQMVLRKEENDWKVFSIR
jgi:hypothetical protein